MANLKQSAVFQDYEGDWIVVFNHMMFGMFSSEQDAHDFLANLKTRHVNTCHYAEHVSDLLIQHIRRERMSEVEQ